MNRQKLCAMLVTSCMVFLSLDGLSRVGFASSTAYFFSTDDMESFCQQFLTNVVMLNTSGYQTTFSMELPPPTYSTTHFDNECSVTISNGQNQFSAIFSFTDGKLWFFDLDASQANLNVSVAQDFNGSMNGVVKALTNYQGLSNAAFRTDFVNLATAALQTQELAVENENFSLQIENTTDGLTATCFEKIAGEYTNPLMSMRLTISETGLLTELYDGISIHHVATTNVTMSEDQAIALAEPFIQDYGAENGQNISAINATFEYRQDVLQQRGDTSALYPSWDIEAWYDHVENDTYGYSVIFWADNGQVSAAGPDTLVGSPTGTNNPFDWRLLLLPCSVITFAGAFGVYQHRRLRKRRK